MPEVIQLLHDECIDSAKSGIPVYRRLIELMTAMIADGRLADGMRLAPDSVLAAQIGISHITLAKVLNELRRRGMVERSRSRGTFIRTPKIALPGTSGTGKLVAVLFDDIPSSPEPNAFVAKLAAGLRESGFDVLLYTAAMRPEQQLRQLREALTNPECCGAIIWSLLTEEMMPEVLAAKPADWPLIFLSGSHNLDGEWRHDFIHYDGYGACLEAAERFLKSGGRRFTFLIEERHMRWTVLNRIRGLWQALAHHAAGEVNPVEVLLWRDAVKKFDRLLDRADGSLLIAASPHEITLLSDEAERRGIDLKRLLPAVGLAAADHTWSLPQYRFDAGELADGAVTLFVARHRGDRGAFRQVWVPGIKEHFELFP